MFLSILVTYMEKSGGDILKLPFMQVPQPIHTMDDNKNDNDKDIVLKNKGFARTILVPQRTIYLMVL